MTEVGLGWRWAGGTVSGRVRNVRMAVDRSLAHWDQNASSLRLFRGYDRVVKVLTAVLADI